jgi:hypothetical protein
MNKNEIILFETADNEVSLQVQMKDETVWLTRNQMAELFDRDVKTIGKHINNAIREELAGQVVVAKFATTTQHGAIPGKTQTHMTDYYNLDVIISVGYRVKSQRGVEFRRWANAVLKDYILRGYAVNDKRINQLGHIVQIMKRAENQLDAHQVLSVVESYSAALDILDDYDHQTLAKPRGNRATYVLTYDECRSVIDKMTFVSDSNLFGNEKDDSFKGSIGAIYQSFDGKDLYPSLEEKAAVVLKWWCRQNNIPYNNDMDNIEAAYRRYYKCEEEGDNYSLIYHLAMH